MADGSLATVMVPPVSLTMCRWSLIVSSVPSMVRPDTVIVVPVIESADAAGLSTSSRFSSVMMSVFRSANSAASAGSSWSARPIGSELLSVVNRAVTDACGLAWPVVPAVSPDVLDGEQVDAGGGDQCHHDGDRRDDQRGPVLRRRRRLLAGIGLTRTVGASGTARALVRVTLRRISLGGRRLLPRPALLAGLRTWLLPGLWAGGLLARLPRLSTVLRRALRCWLPALRAGLRTRLLPALRAGGLCPRLLPAGLRPGCCQPCGPVCGPGCCQPCGPVAADPAAASPAARWAATVPAAHPHCRARTGRAARPARSSTCHPFGRPCLGICCPGRQRAMTVCRARSLRSQRPRGQTVISVLVHRWHVVHTACSHCGP